ncbi:MAG: hypothetical protein IT378_10525, partial [Sandaracinaceae bacterium]|nr:hypothetical protein [Sandaracinaceae bacterium]
MLDEARVKQLLLYICVSAAVLPAAPRARADCEVGGRASLGRLRVRVPGTGIATFAVEDLPLAVRPGRGNLYRRARVLSPIAFEARTDARIPWALAREGSVSQGLLHWTSEATIEDAREIGEDEVELRVRLAEGVVLARVRVPCAEVRVGAAASGPEARAPGRGPLWAPAGGQTWLA